MELKVKFIFVNKFSTQIQKPPYTHTQNTTQQTKTHIIFH